jgi:DNA-directed RNA polymerase specialized sigma24 family protein
MSDITLTRDAWDQLLRALDPDVAQAAARYERLRRCLIALYRSRALPDPEDLADQVLDGVARSLADPRREVGAALREVAHQVGDAAHRGRRARAIALAALPALDGPDDPDDVLAQLCRCLDELPELDRRSLLSYEGADGDRSRRRQALAAELGIPVNALRVRMHRLRVRLLARLGGARRTASPIAGVIARRVVAQVGEPVADREPLDRPALQGPAPRAAAERGPHEPQPLAGIDPDAERRRRLLIIADRLQRRAGRAVQRREHQAEPPRVEPQGHPAGAGLAVRGGVDVEAGP